MWATIPATHTSRAAAGRSKEVIVEGLDVSPTSIRTRALEVPTYAVVPTTWTAWMVPRPVTLLICAGLWANVTSTRRSPPATEPT